MNFEDAKELMALGAKAKLTDWPSDAYIKLDNGVIVDQDGNAYENFSDSLRLDWNETEDSLTNEPEGLDIDGEIKEPAALDDSPITQHANGDKLMAEIKKGSIEPIGVHGMYQGKKADVVRVISASSSNPSKARIIFTQNSNSIYVEGLQPTDAGETLTVNVSGVILDEAGQAMLVESVSNLFTVVDSLAMVQAINDDGSLKVDDNGLPVMVSAEASLSVSVPLAA